MDDLNVEQQEKLWDIWLVGLERKPEQKLSSKYHFLPSGHIHLEYKDFYQELHDPAGASAWLEERPERSKPLRPTKIRDAWKSTSGVAPSIEHLRRSAPASPPTAPVPRNLPKSAQRPSGAAKRDVPPQPAASQRSYLLLSQSEALLQRVRFGPDQTLIIPGRCK
ncbi:hypothetical protein T484DRAFT_2027603 [Baffinella frigidus]|nr:hypothetical protein T484DRAFT_2027603 [Cryptophyta sp. CCMP2293]|mmetsp:Transcript_45797/g.109258  ORF Transcript_45797/g.109258 Transcript_45797/m.109258 type:complete len:165 (+) Transcript_45797:47-541(+)